MSRTTPPYYPRAGISHVGSYQISGIPYITGGVIPAGVGEAGISFPYVAKTVTITNRSTAELRVHFNSLSSNPNVIGNHHYITLDQNRDSFTFPVRCKKVYVSLVTGSANGHFECFAELTGIPTNEMYNLTGSGVDD